MPKPLDRPDIDDLPYGCPDPRSSRACFRNALAAAGNWHDDMNLTHLVGIGQTVQMIGGRPLYTLHRLPLLGPIDPVTERGLYVTALLDLAGGRYPFV